MNTDPKFTEKEFDDALKKLFKKERLESPSFHFTEDVMDKVRMEVKLQSYRPVISKLGWVIVAFFILAVVVFAMLAPATSSSAPAWITKATEYLNSGKPDVQFLGSISGFFNELNVSGLLLPLAGLLLAMGFHGLVMKRFYFRGKKNMPNAYMF
jgi:Ni,Fe-hydrogenase I large subunit